MRGFLPILNVLLSLTTSFMSSVLAEPIFDGGNSMNQGVLRVEIDGVTQTSRNLPIDRPIALPVEPRFRTVRQARIIETPAGTTNFKCFLISSDNEIPSRFVSGPFGISQTLQSPFSRADTIYCYDFPREDIVYMLMVTDKIELGILEVELDDRTSIDYDETAHVVYRAHILQAPSDMVGCALVGPDASGFVSDLILISRPLPRGLDPLASTLACADASSG